MAEVEEGKWTERTGSGEQSVGVGKSGVEGGGGWFLRCVSNNCSIHVADMILRWFNYTCDLLWFFTLLALLFMWLCNQIFTYLLNALLMWSTRANGANV